MSNNVNLTVTPNALYELVASTQFQVSLGDLSQLGLDRSRLRAELCIPIGAAYKFIFANAANHPFWRNFLRVPLNTAEGTSVLVTVDTRGLENSDIGGNPDAHSAAIRDLQKSLDPVTLVTSEDIFNSDRVQARIRRLRAEVTVAASTFAAFVNNLASLNARVASYITSADIADIEQATIVPGAAVTVTPKNIIDVAHDKFMALSSLLGEMNEAIRSAYQLLEFVKLIDATPEPEILLEHPLLTDEAHIAHGELMNLNFRTPPIFAKIYDRQIGSARVVTTIQFIYEQTVTNVPALDAHNLTMSELGIYLLSLKQITATSPERNREFAAARTLVIRHSLDLDSQEKAQIVFRNLDPLAVDPVELKEFVNFLRNPEAAYAAMYTSVVSFLKSGHHATAANLDNTFMRIMGSIGQPIGINVARDMLATAVYTGPHVASTRVLLGYLLMRNARESVTGALSYRLHPTPPMAAAFTNLEIFIEALNSAMFFSVLDKQHEYREFKNAMREIKATMYYVAPYAHYLYGKSAPDPSSAKATAAKLAAYAASIGDALPNTTLTMSPALMKLAHEANRNSISSALYVTAYSGAFVRYFRTSIEGALQKKLGAPIRAIATAQQ